MDRTIGEIEGRNASSSVKGKKQGLKNSWKNCQFNSATACSFKDFGSHQLAI